jgi:hypothetical protein
MALSDQLHKRGQRYRKQQSDTAPHPAPKQHAYRRRYRADVHPRTDKFGYQQVIGNQVQQGHCERDDYEWSGTAELERGRE